MATDIYMPLMGLTMSEGTVVRWLKSTGNPVKKGEAVLEIETDKATVEIEAPSDGVIGPILVAEGKTVPVGTILSHVLSSAEYGARSSASSVESSAELATSVTLHSRIFVSPLARRVAAEQQVDLRQVEASGPGGRVVVADVHAHLAQSSVSSLQSPVSTRPTPVPSQPVVDGNLAPVSSIRRIIAERMVASRQTTAHVTLALEAEATGLAAWRAALKADGQTVSYNELLVAVVAKALREHPALMTQITADGQLKTPSQVNIGLAVDTPRGLLVPVLRDLAGKGTAQIAAEAQALIDRARTGKLKPDELSGGVFTISNLGMYEIELFTPVINLPECAILGVGSIAERAVVRDGQVCARLTVALSLAFDHRIVDGAPAARFLQRVKQLIEQPLRLLG